MLVLFGEFHLFSDTAGLQLRIHSLIVNCPPMAQQPPSGPEPPHYPDFTITR